jgi:cellulose synthase/poly-beta-1,6-N-acetylglucosamine synthase-like glycosyltransferase
VSQFLIALLWAPLVLLGVMSLSFVSQVLLGCMGTRKGSALADASSRGCVAVLVPAHNESAGIARTVRSVLPQLRHGDRLLVVADNCQDDTAAVARSLGAEVTERSHATLRGKGYALDHGVQHLRAMPASMVLMIDADCTLHPGSLDILALRCQQVEGPVQGCDLMLAPPGASLKTKVAAFAWAVKNKARPLGGARMAWPCQLMGTGMIFPWAIIEAAPLASGHLAEDMQLGAVLAARGHLPVYCDEALVTSLFPTDSAVQATQRARWEHGHLSVILTQGPAMFKRALQRRSWPLLGMALDMCVPPLTSLVMALMVAWLLAALVVWQTRQLAPIACATSLLLAVAVAVMFAWWRHGRALISGREFLSVPLYALAKVPIYAGFIARRQTGWIRTRRDDDPK